MNLPVHYITWDPDMKVKHLILSKTDEPNSCHVLKGQEDPEDALRAGEMGYLIEWIQEKYDPEITFGKALALAVNEYGT